MTRSSYGKTWWGEQWLAALTHLDYDNRLPRGRSYANKGAVRQLTVKAGSIQARVQGSRLYQVTITVPPIAPKDAAKLLDRIAADPVLIARMLNRELDPALLALAADLGIAVFPTRWTDLSMQCSCPDWAVPCKHLAATIYLLSREIDGNPFLVFSLRGLDLATALKDRDIQIESRAGATLPSLAELLPSGDERGRADDGGDRAARWPRLLAPAGTGRAAVARLAGTSPVLFGGRFPRDPGTFAGPRGQSGPPGAGCRAERGRRPALA